MENRVLKNLNKKIPQTSSIVASGISKLYLNEDHNDTWSDPELEGLLTLVIDRNLQTSFVKLFDANNYDLLFETELYYDFFSHYKALEQNFFCFPLQNCQVGVYFKDSQTAQTFSAKLNQFSPNLPQKRDSETEISQPYAAQLISSLVWDPLNQSFNLNYLSDQIKRVFKNAGIKENELEESKTATTIFSEIVKHGNFRTFSIEKNTPQASPRKSSAYQLQKSFVEELEKSSSVEVPEEQAPTQEEVTFTNHLENKIAERRAELTKYDLSDESSDYSSSD